MGKKKIHLINGNQNLIAKTFNKRYDNNVKNKENIFTPAIMKIRKELFKPCQNCPKRVRTLTSVPVEQFVFPNNVVIKGLCDECTLDAKRTNKLPNFYCEICKKFVETPVRKCDTCNKFVCDVNLCDQNMFCTHAKKTYTPALICYDCVKQCDECTSKVCPKCFDNKTNKCNLCI